MVEHNKNKLRTIRIYCTRIGCFLFTVYLVGPVFLIYYLKTFVCSAQEAENLILYSFAAFLLLQAVTWFFFALGAALQSNDSIRKRAATFMLYLAVSWGVFLGPLFLPQTQLRIQNEWLQGKVRIEQHFAPNADKSTWPRRCISRRAIKPERRIAA